MTRRQINATTFELLANYALIEEGGEITIKSDIDCTQYEVRDADGKIVAEKSVSIFKSTIDGECSTKIVHRVEDEEFFAEATSDEYMGEFFKNAA